MQICYNDLMGILYIVATPIGNLKDITLRALEILKEADFILCEDTRRTIKLLNHYRISKPLISYFQHSGLSKTEYIIGLLKSGKKLALATDAGTPGISDPGGKLIKAIVSELPEALISPVPGPAAFAAALSASGFPADKFVFLGFPPHKKGRQTFFKNLAREAEEKTIVFYESPYRIIKTLEQLKDLPVRAAVCRELTKKFETIYRGSPKEIIEKFVKDKNSTKGEFVIVLCEERRKSFP